MIMKKIQSLSLLILFALISFFCGASFAADISHSSDLIPSSIKMAAKSAALPGMTLSRDTIHFSWNLNADATITAPTPHMAESREFYMDVDAASMRSGVAIKTTARGSIVKLSPSGAGVNAKSKSLSADDIVVRIGGESIVLRDFAARVDDSKKLAASGVEFAPGSLAFLIDDARGAATFEVALKSADRSYLVHVFEPASPNALTLTTNRDAYLVGEKLNITAAATNGAAITEITGGIASPEGALTAVTFKRGADGQFTAVIPLTESTSGALYEAYAVAKLNDGSVIASRDAKVSFAVAEPTARLINIADGSDQFDAANFNTRLDVAASGRYQVEALLYGQKGGVSVPIAIAHTGAWLNAGENVVPLQFDNLDLAKRGVEGPFTLGNFALKNQGNLATMERRVQVATKARVNRSFE
jgi:Domain of unknown function (DUF4785)